jgi:hypothetical protein
MIGDGLIFHDPVDTELSAVVRLLDIFEVGLDVFPEAPASAVIDELAMVEVPAVSVAESDEPTPDGLAELNEVGSVSVELMSELVLVVGRGVEVVEEPHGFLA